ncbi:hypothetical protein QR680_007204 [Steinernema hermaphroditum]|uniref:Sushi domain-containing protein n=1 Tax=Steinernema hermaphroditum TaxID=289476 RepID=A0AA39LXU6_9BILA|nr:hypothetical protein QR680_007204 [Steinernema hermaphroditum]
MVLILFLLLFFTGPETTAAKEDYRYAVLNVKINGQTKNATGILDFEECGYEAYKKVAFAFELHANETHVLECTLIWNFTRFERSPLEKDAKEGKLYFIVDKRDHEEGICEKERNESVREVLADFGKCLGNSRICHDLEHVSALCDKFKTDKDCLGDTTSTTRTTTTTSTSTSTETPCPAPKRLIGGRCCDFGIDGQKNICCPTDSFSVKLPGIERMCCKDKTSCCPKGMTTTGHFKNGVATCCQNGYTYNERERRCCLPLFPFKVHSTCCPEDTKFRSYWNGKSICCPPLVQGSSQPADKTKCCPPGYRYGEQTRKCVKSVTFEHGTISFEELKKKCASEGEGGVPIKWNESSSHDNLDEKESGKSYEIHKVGCKVDTVNSIYW